MPKQAGLTPTLAELTVRDNHGNTLATTSVNGEYADAPKTKRRVGKERAVAKIRNDMTAEDASKERIQDRIREVEKTHGWTETAEKLRQNITEADEHGGKICISKQKVDDKE